MVPPPGAPAPAPAGSPSAGSTTTPRTGFLAVVAGATLWGTGGLAGSALAGEGLPLATVAAYRLGVGGGALLLLAVTGRLGRLRLTGAVVRRVLVTAVLAAGYQTAYFVAVGRSSVSLATLVALGAAPVLVAAATAVLARRLPSRRTVTALLLAVAGLVLLVGLAGAGVGADPAGGALLALGAAAAFAALTMVNRTGVPGLDPVLLTALGFSAGGLLLVPVALLGGGAVGPATATGWWLVLYLGVVPTALAYAAYFTGLRAVPATTASLVALLEPLTAALLAAVLLGERLGAAGAVGGLLLAAATVAVAPRRRRRRRGAA
jgi:DME family drug/metabolite transporter